MRGRDGLGLGRHRLGRKRERRDRGVELGLRRRLLPGARSGAASFLRSEISFFHIELEPDSAGASTASSSGLRRNESSFFQIDVGFSSSAIVSPPRS